MKLLKGLIIGIIIDFTACTIITLFMKILTIGDKNLLLWLLSISLPWFAIGYSLIYIRLNKVNLSIIKFRIEIAFFSFILLLLSSTIGIIIVEFITRGFETIAMKGYIYYGLIYSIICLPLLFIVNYFILKKELLIKNL